MTGGLPGLIGIDHVALTVPDLDEAKAFYCGLLGGELLYTLGPFDARELPKEADGSDWTEAHLNVPDARLQFHAVRLGDVTLELFEYARPTDVETVPPRNSDLGGHHVGLQVTDVRTAAVYLQDNGVRVFSGPIEVPEEAPSGGMLSWYFCDPWGNQLELTERV